MNTSTEIREALKQGIKDTQEGAKQKVVDHYVQKEVDRRSDLIIKGLEKLESLEKARDQIKPDNVIKDAEGKVIQNGYAEATYGKLEKSKQAVEKLNKALNGALKEANYEALEKALK